MGERIGELPQTCRAAWENVTRLELPREYADVDNIVVLGMGGSAIGGDLVRTLYADECRVPIIVSREYAPPQFVGARTLVIASSHAGNTEETLMQFEAAHARGAKMIAMATGGELAERARAKNVPVLTYEYPTQPRAAIGFALVHLVGILYKLGFVGDQTRALDEAVMVIEGWQNEIKPVVPIALNVAKRLAQKLFARVPVMYGAGILSEVAHRWKTQFNENAKSFAFYEVFPELNHNAVVGYEFPAEAKKMLMVVMLRSGLNHPRIRARGEITRDLLKSAGVATEVIEARGEAALAQMLSLIHFGDYVSYYLAMLGGADPMPVAAIDLLKARLALE
jgi:glucose/mannose-6-phosphate isomerase